MAGDFVPRLLPYLGSKATLAPVIIDLAGKHNAWFEPFAGSMSVVLQKPRVPLEVLNDMHGDLVNLARVACSHRALELHGMCSRTLVCESIHEEFAGYCCEPGPVAGSVAGVRDEHVQRAYWYLVSQWMGRNGMSGTVRENESGFAKRYGSGGGTEAARWLSVTGSIQAWQRRLSHCRIECGDGIDFVGRVKDAAGAVVYADPPYILEGASYAVSPGKSPAEIRSWHRRLASALWRFRSARVVVSYYDHPWLEEMYPTWRVVRPSAKKNLGNQAGATGAQAAPEVLLVNDGVDRKSCPDFASPVSGGLFAA